LGSGGEEIGQDGGLNSQGKSLTVRPGKYQKSAMDEGETSGGGGRGGKGSRKGLVSHGKISLQNRERNGNRGRRTFAAENRGHGEGGGLKIDPGHIPRSKQKTSRAERIGKTAGAK